VISINYFLKFKNGESVSYQSSLNSNGEVDKKCSTNRQEWFIAVNREQEFEECDATDE